MPPQRSCVAGRLAPLTRRDREDVIHNAHLLLCKVLGRDYMQRIAQIFPFGESGRAEHGELTRATDHAVSGAVPGPGTAR